MLLQRQTLWLMLVVLSGCAALGVPSLDTFNKQLLASVTVVEGIRRDGGVLLQSRLDEIAAKQSANILTPEQAQQRRNVAADDAQNIQDQADKARAGLEIARVMRGTNPVAATERLNAIAIGLKALQEYLRANP